MKLVTAVTAAVAVLAVANAAGPAGAAGSPPPATMRATASSSATGVALAADGSAALDVFRGINGGKLARASTRAVPGADTVYCSAIDPAGKTALACRFTDSLYAMNLASHVTPAPAIDLSAFGHEGRTNFSPYTKGVALGRGFGLVAVSETGVVQLREAGDVWSVDSRVQSPGLNDAGDAHAPGFITIPQQPLHHETFDGVALSPLPLKDGRYVAIAVDAYTNHVAVVAGVGTAHPAVTALMGSFGLERTETSDVGSGGVAFSPVTPTTAVVMIAGGVAVLDLSDLSNPKRYRQAIGVPPMSIHSVAVAPDGDHVDIAAQNHLYIYKGLLSNNGTLTRVKDLLLGAEDGNGQIYATSYLRNGDLAVQHAEYDPVSKSTIPEFSIVHDADRNRPTIGPTVKGVAPPDAPNTMSVYPGVATMRSVAKRLGHLTKGTESTGRFVARHAVGRVRFTVTNGSLPTGLSLARDGSVDGKPKAVGTWTATIRAV
ncbi:MAG: hypothetical protein JO246_02715, partial [Frankiaceae bacterium]|nr:hypothetical protein [Frankiaceae bacterium]